MPKSKNDPYIWGTGRRKTSIARVRLKPGGTGKVTVNKKPLNKYFGTEREWRMVMAPLEKVGAAKTYDVFVNATGGGFSGQAGAIAMGLARALLSANTEYEDTLRDGKFLTRDAREKERKKYGRRGARRGFQFSKR